MYPEFWLKNWSIPSTDSAVKLQELVRLGYEHAVARAEASARMARSLSACRTPFDAIAVYQDWIVSESQRIVGDMRRMAELSKALLESSGQALNAPMQSPMHAVAEAMLRPDPGEEEQTGATEKPGPTAMATTSNEPPAAKSSPPAAAAKAETPPEPEAAKPAPRQTPSPEAAAPQPPAGTTEAVPESPAPASGPAPEESAGDAEEGTEGEENKGRRKRKSAAAE